MTVTIQNNTANTLASPIHLALDHPAAAPL
jgi:hypothetical protein